MMLSQDQLNAACDEAKKLGLRSLVHAYKDAVRAATLAGCTEIEHGVLATDDDLRLMASKGTFLDPQAGLVWGELSIEQRKVRRHARLPHVARRFCKHGAVDSGYTTSSCNVRSRFPG